jgi:hypothetical protein
MADDEAIERARRSRGCGGMRLWRWTGDDRADGASASDVAGDRGAAGSRSACGVVARATASRRGIGTRHGRVDRFTCRCRSTDAGAPDYSSDHRGHAPDPKPNAAATHRGRERGGAGARSPDGPARDAATDRTRTGRSVRRGGVFVHCPRENSRRTGGGRVDASVSRHERWGARHRQAADVHRRRLGCGSSTDGGRFRSHGQRHNPGRHRRENRFHARAATSRASQIRSRARVDATECRAVDAGGFRAASARLRSTKANPRLNKQARRSLSCARDDLTSKCRDRDSNPEGVTPTRF